MEQTREPIFTPDAGKLVGKAVGMTQAALASDAGKAVRSVIAHGPDGLMQHLSQAAQKHTHDPDYAGAGAAGRAEPEFRRDAQRHRQDRHVACPSSTRASRRPSIPTRRRF